MAKSILLASFIKQLDLNEALTKIKATVGLTSRDLFVFSSSTIDDYIVTYNINSEYANLKFSSIWPDTISIHRKRDTNTLFSINAMNRIIQSKNNGELNPNYKINWAEYRNCFLLIRNGRINIIPIELL